MKNIKSKIAKLMLVLALVGGFAACSDKDMFTKELYMKIFAMLCDENNIYEIVQPFNEDGSDRFVSVLCGGSQLLEQDVTVQIGVDNDSMLNRYNEREFALDVQKYAVRLPENRYVIADSSVIMSSSSTDQYVQVPIKVFMNGLSPDTTYFLPVYIKSVSSGDTINEAKRHILYHPIMKNDYAEQATAYTSKGYMREYNQLQANRGNFVLTNASPSDIASEKLLYPIDTDKIRLTIGSYKSLDGSNNASLDNIQKYSVIVTVGDNGALKIEPYVEGSMEVELLNDSVQLAEANTLVATYPTADLEKLYLSDYYINYYDNAYTIENSRQCFFLCYRYKLAGTTRWYRVQERIRKNS